MKETTREMPRDVRRSRCPKKFPSIARFLRNHSIGREMKPAGDHGGAIVVAGSGHVRNDYDIPVISGKRRRHS